MYRMGDILFIFYFYFFFFFWGGGMLKFQIFLGVLEIPDIFGGER